VRCSFNNILRQGPRQSDFLGQSALIFFVYETMEKKIELGKEEKGNHFHFRNQPKYQTHTEDNED